MIESILLGAIIGYIFGIIITNMDNEENGGNDD